MDGPAHPCRMTGWRNRPRPDARPNSTRRFRDASKGLDAESRHMYRVLFPVDADEDRALAQAAFVASLPDVADSVEAFVLYVFHGDGEDLPEELKRFDSAARVGSVRRAREYLTERDVEVTILEDSGDTADDVVAEADRHDVDAIVLGGRKCSVVGKAIFGSVTQSVIRETDRPVVVTGSKRH